MDEKILILGSTGLLGQALVKEAQRRGCDYLGVSRRTEPSLDVTDPEALARLIETYQPTVVVNTVALVALAQCEDNPELAAQVNANPAQTLAALSEQHSCYWVQISTDHYYTGDGAGLHSEEAPLVLLNEYARSKRQGELYALQSQSSCVVRTNIVGFRGELEQPTFAEGMITALQQKTPLTLFSDYYTSSIDVTSFSKALFDLLPKRPSGILNLASREVSSKAQFVQCLAQKLGLDLSCTRIGSVSDMPVNIKRAESLGLDVTKAEQLLGYSLPTLDNVIDQLVREYCLLMR